jgi:hypothetical protein
MTVIKPVCDLRTDAEKSLPLLSALIESGHIFYDPEEQEYVGECDDGTQVGFGFGYNAHGSHATQEEGVGAYRMEQYLRKHPTPSDW